MPTDDPIETWRNARQALINADVRVQALEAELCIARVAVNDATLCEREATRAMHKALFINRNTNPQE